MRMKFEKGIGIVESFDAKVFFCCFSTSDILLTLWIDCLVRIKVLSNNQIFDHIRLQHDQPDYLTMAHVFE